MQMHNILNAEMLRVFFNDQLAAIVQQTIIYIVYIAYRLLRVISPGSEGLTP